MGFFAIKVYNGIYQLIYIVAYFHSHTSSNLSHMYRNLYTVIDSNLSHMYPNLYTVIDLNLSHIYGHFLS